MSTHNICFYGKKGKYLPDTPSYLMLCIMIDQYKDHAVFQYYELLHYLLHSHESMMKGFVHNIKD